VNSIEKNCAKGGNCYSQNQVSLVYCFHARTLFFGVGRGKKTVIFLVAFDLDDKKWRNKLSGQLVHPIEKAH